MPFRTKRVYEEPASQDGTRVLVDRLWPRSISKADAAIDEWIKDAAPSPALRIWFNHDPAKWHEFVGRYHDELDADPGKLARLLELGGRGRNATITLLYAAKDETHNHAQALMNYLARRE